jgi:glyoxylase I family protein
MQFHHLAVNCRNQATIEAYYTKHFEFKRARAFDIGGGLQIIFLEGPGVHLELFQTGPQAEQGIQLTSPVKDGRDYPSVIRHLAFKVDDVDAKLAAMGADAQRVTLGPLRFDGFIPGWKSVWLSDPEGNIVEISQGYVDNTPAPAGR